jgi:hypothetical protein
MTRVLRHVRSNLVAYLALFVALGGTSYAAVNLPRNSVGTAQLKANAVTSAKVKNGSLLAADFRRGQLRAGPAGAAGPAGPAGERGAAGERGTPGPSYAAVGDRGTPLLADKPATAQEVTFTTPDAGDVLVIADVDISLGCGGTDGPGYRCGVQWALSVDGKSAKGSGNGLVRFATSDSRTDGRTLIGIVPDLPAGTHKLRLHLGTDQAGTAVLSGPFGLIWGATAVRVGDSDA